MSQLTLHATPLVCAAPRRAASRSRAAPRCCAAPHANAATQPPLLTRRAGTAALAAAAVFAVTPRLEAAADPNAVPEPQAPITKKV
jgi:hypothetical protein